MSSRHASPSFDRKVKAATSQISCFKEFNDEFLNSISYTKEILTPK